MVAGIRKEKLVAEIKSNDHRMWVDVEKKLGGTDKWPDPHRLFEASLAACTIITVQMYADRKNWKLDSTDVKVNIEKEGPESLVSLEISFRGDLTPEQIERLFVIAGKCPIHKLMSSPLSVSMQKRDFKSEP